jgi:hypothetical protein
MAVTGHPHAVPGDLVVLFDDDARRNLRMQRADRFTPLRPTRRPMSRIVSGTVVTVPPWSLGSPVNDQMFLFICWTCLLSGI